MHSGYGRDGPWNEIPQQLGVGNIEARKRVMHKVVVFVLSWKDLRKVVIGCKNTPEAMIIIEKNAKMFCRLQN